MELGWEGMDLATMAARKQGLQADLEKAGFGVEVDWGKEAGVWGWDLQERVDLEEDKRESGETGVQDLEEATVKREVGGELD